MGKMHKRSFASMTEMLTFAIGDSDLPEYNRSSRNEDYGDNGWHGTRNFAAAEKMAFNWPEGAERVKALRAKVSLGDIRKAKEIVATRKAPGRIDMGRVMQGHPYAFQRVQDAEQDTTGVSRNVVDIFINVACSAAVDTDAIEARGAAVLALADALEQRGKRVRITVGMSTSGGSMTSEYTTVVKQAGQPLNLNSVAFAVAHPSFLRRFMFSAMECESASVRKGLNVPGGYGMVREFTGLPEGTIYLGGADWRNSTKWNDTSYVQTWIKEEMARHGVTID